MKEYYSIAELLELKLDGLPGTRKGLGKYLERNDWKYIEVSSRGKGGQRKEYALPDQFKNQLLAKAITTSEKKENLTVCLKEPDAINAAEMADWQRSLAENRLFVVRYIQQQVAQGAKKTRVIEQFIADAEQQNLPTEMQDAVLKANAKAGDSRTVSRRSLFDWVKAVEDAEKNKQPVIAALAPKARAMQVPVWAVELLKLWAQPQKPSLTVVLEQLPNYLKDGMACPTYHQAYRFLKEKMGNVDVQKGRMGERELKNLKPFIRRDTSNLLPTDVYTADGHCFDAEVAHPMNGKPFRPEITSIIDVATRRLVGVSVDLAESSFAVLDALRTACCKAGVPALFYVDNGSGYHNDLLKDNSRGVLARLGTEMTHALPYNSQAKGLVERSHRSIWIKAAKTLDTYIGKDMDAEASNKVHKLTRKEIVLFGQSKALISWSDFMQLVPQVIETYNNKPHRGLATTIDPVTLKRRHLTPNEAWQKALEMGATVDLIEDWDREDLFRPYEERKVRRGEIELFGNRYFSKELEQFHGDNVLVGYDIHDADRITVRTEDGQFICYAHWNANKRDYFAKSKIQQAREQRALGRLRRLAVKQNEVHEELSPRQVIDHIEEKTVSLDDLKRQKLMNELNGLAQSVEKEVIYFKAKSEVKAVQAVEVKELSPKQRWMDLDSRQANGEVLTEVDQDFWEMFPLSKKFKQLEEEDAELIAYLAQRHA